MTIRNINGKLKKGFIAMTMTIMVMTMTACGTDEETAYQDYYTESSDYITTSDSGYDNDYESHFESDNASYDDECLNTASADGSSSYSSESADSAVTSSSYDNDCDTVTSYSYDDDYDYDEACSDGEFDTADYASDAQVRTNEVEFTVGYPNIGGTEAELETEVINRNGGTITMIGCTVYDDMGTALVSWNESCNITSSTFDITCSTKNDLDYILQDIIYHYKFVVEIDGEFYTHRAATFTTNHADDKFMFQIQPVELTKEIATVSVEVTNPTMANVATVGCRVNTPQGIQLADVKETVNTTDQNFIVDFELKYGNENLPSSEDYGYQFYIIYNGIEYNSCYEDFTTLP